jgi:hypothetical protein
MKNKSGFCFVVIYCLVALYTYGYCFGNVNIQKQHYKSDYKNVSSVEVAIHSFCNAVIWPIFWSVELQWHEYEHQPSSDVPVEDVQSQGEHHAVGSSN